MFKLPIPTRLTDYLGEAVVWTVIYPLPLYTFQAEMIQGKPTWEQNLGQGPGLILKMRETVLYESVEYTPQETT